MAKLDLIKKAAGLTVSLGVGVIVTSAVKAVVPVPKALPLKILVGSGTWFLAGYLGEQAAEQVGKEIQEVADGVAAFKEAWREAKNATTIVITEVK